VASCSPTACVDQTGRQIRSRPEHVVGSYAVYHKTRRDHYPGKPNYRAGKVAHIYRPRIVDAAGKAVWGELSAEPVLGRLTITIPQEFLETAFGYVELDWKRYVAVDPKLLRPVETGRLAANCAKARQALGWSPKIGFGDLVRAMVDADLEALGLPAPGEGKRIVRERLGEWHQWQGAVQESLAGASRETE